MKPNPSTSQKIGLATFMIGAVWMFGLGWLYSWWMVPAANQFGPEAYSRPVGIFWQLSVPLGAFIVAIGAALAARVERRTIWLLILLLVLTFAWAVAGTARQMIPALFGVGGGLITLFFIGSTWEWASIRPTLAGAAKTGSDLRLVGFIFFVSAAWNLCGVFGIGYYVLRPELAVQFSIPIGSTINAASTVMVLLVLGWGFSYFGQRVSRRAQAVKTALVGVPQTSGGG